MFAGLNENTNYDKLEISIDNSNFIEVERDNTNNYNSTQISFTKLNSNILYVITGRITINNTTSIIETKTTAQDGKLVGTFDYTQLPTSTVINNLFNPIIEEST